MTIPNNLPDHMRPGISIVVLAPYVPDTAEQHVQGIIDEQVQEEHTSQWYMKVFAKMLINFCATNRILRQETKTPSRKTIGIKGSFGP